MEPEGSLTRSHVPITCPYPESTRSSSYPTSHFLRSILILSSHLRLGLTSGLFLSGCPMKTLYTPLLSPYVLQSPHISLFFFFNQTILDEECKSLSSSLFSFFFLFHCYLVPLRPKHDATHSLPYFISLTNVSNF